MTDPSTGTVPAPRRSTSPPILSVITPTFNEAQNLPVLIERIHTALAGVPHEIVVADDNSPDGTWRIAEELAALDDSIVVLRRFHDHGLSAAVLDAMSAARAPYLAVIDADLQHDPSILPDMLSCLRADKADVVVGSRESEGAATESGACNGVPCHGWRRSSPGLPACSHRRSDERVLHVDP
ncbi:MAG: glycosyltransferase [Microthrixaceae bacterium]|nr:glycosyltransferase [Microthrixaceae bacterium]